MKKILGLSIVALMVIGLVGGGTWAFFQDTETSSGNQFAAGTLDLTIDGGNTDSLIFAIDAAEGYPGMTPVVNEYAAMKNVGSVTGKLGIEVLNVLDLESTGTTEYESDSIGGAHVSGVATGGSISTVVHAGAGWGADAYIGRMVTVTGKGSGIITGNTGDTLTISGEFSEAVVNADDYMIIGGGELGAKVEVRIWVDTNIDADFDDGVDYYLIAGGTNSTSAAGYAAAWDALADLVGDYAEIVDMAEDAEYHVYVDWQIPFGESADNSFQGDSVQFDLEFTLEQVEA